MASRLRAPVLALAALSICLNIAIVGTAGRTLNTFNTQQTSNPYFLPLWPDHFDTRELATLIGCSAAIVVLNAILVAVCFFPKLPTNLLVLASSFLSFVLSLVAIIFPTLLNQHAPTRDTLQTWTCMWRGVSDQGVPEQFDTLCHESRFAFYTTVPSFILQLVLLGAAVYAITVRSPPSRLRLDEEEKGRELHRSRTESPQSEHITMSNFGKR